MRFFRTAILIASLTALAMLIGAAIAGIKGLLFALAFACALNLFTYWNSDKIVLRSFRAREITDSDPPSFHTYRALCLHLAARAGLPPPHVAIISQNQPNAFATGRNPQNAAVVASSGLISMLNREELAGVIAHELAHIENRDTLTMTISAILAGAITSIAQFAFFFRHGRNGANILFMLLAPLAAAMIQMAISRTREYAADARGAEICQNPLALASALEKISAPARSATANPQYAHMFIVSPLKGSHGDNLFSTHPSTLNRIAALRDIHARMHPQHAPSFSSDNGSLPGFSPNTR